MRTLLCIALLFLSACGFKTADEANGKNNNDNNGSTTTFTNNTTAHSITGNTDTVTRQAGAFVSSVSNGSSFTTTTTTGTFTTQTLLSVVQGSAITFETVTNTDTSTVLSQRLRFATLTANVTSVASFRPTLNAGKSIDLTSGQSINVFSGTTLTTATTFDTLTQHGSTVPTIAGARLEAPASTSGVADIIVAAQ